jgi:predicted nucleic acid-binding protein
MRILFGDTFYFLGLLNIRDQHSKRIVDFSAGFRGKLVTTDLILLEVADALSSSEERDTLRDYFLHLRSLPSCEVIEGSRELFDRALNLYHRHSDKDWSLTDCTSFVVMRDRGIAEALTGDKHSEQAGFVPLFR